MTFNFKYEDAGEIRTLSVGVKETGIHFNRSEAAIASTWRTYLRLVTHGDESYYMLENVNYSYAYTELSRFSNTAFKNNILSTIDWTDESCQLVASSGMHNFGRNEAGHYYQEITYGDGGSCFLQFFIYTDPETQQSYVANAGFSGFKPHGTNSFIAVASNAQSNLIDDLAHSVRPNIMLLKATMIDDDATSPNYNQDFDVIIIVRKVYSGATEQNWIMIADERLFTGARRNDPSKSTAKGNTPNGFRGGRDDYSDTDTISTISTAISTYANSALHGVHFYHLPTYTEYNEFCEAMWSDDTWAQFESRGEWNPVGGVLALSLMPCYPDYYRNIVTQNIRSSGKELLLNDDPISAITPVESTAQLTSRAIKLLEYSHSFLDWTGYSKAFVRLPFVGIMPIDVSKIMNGGIIIKYNIDFVTGNCLAQIYTIPEQDVMGDRSNDYPYQGYDELTVEGCCVMIGQYAGNCAHKLAYSGASIGGVNTIGSIVSGLVGAAAIVGGAYIERPSMIVGGIGAVGGAISNLAVPNTHPMTQNATPNADTMGMLVPALIVERPIDITPLDENGDATIYENMNGRPSASGGTVRDYKSFDTGEGVSIKGILHADNLYATEDEKRQIEEAFMRGVIL